MRMYAVANVASKLVIVVLSPQYHLPDMIAISSKCRDLILSAIQAATAGPLFKTSLFTRVVRSSMLIGRDGPH